MAKSVDATRSKPITLAALSEYGAMDGFSPPGDFDPGGEWENTYRIWLVGRGDSGFLHIKRKPEDGASATLGIEMLVLQAARTVHQTKVKLKCAGDALSTPQSWEMESQILDINMQPIELSTVKEEVASHDMAASTSNWSLFDAVQRLPGRDTRPLEFSLLEDMDLLKTGQRLSYWQSMSFDAGNNSLQLTGYQQVGHGILPYQYWVDGHHRLLFAVSGIRAYIFDPDARGKIEKALSGLARRKG